MDKSVINMLDEMCRIEENYNPEIFVKDDENRAKRLTNIIKGNVTIDFENFSRALETSYNLNRQEMESLAKLNLIYKLYDNKKIFSVVINGQEVNASLCEIAKNYSKRDVESAIWFYESLEPMDQLSYAFLLGNNIKFSENWRLVGIDNNQVLRVGLSVISLDKYDNPYITYNKILNSGAVNPETTLKPSTVQSKLNTNQLQSTRSR